MKKLAKPIVEVGLFYKGCDFNLDDDIDKVAKKYKGSFVGSGAGFSNRDLQFEFRDFEDAKNFKEEVCKDGVKLVFYQVEFYR